MLTPICIDCTVGIVTNDWTHLSSEEWERMCAVLDDIEVRGHLRLRLAGFAEPGPYDCAVCGTSHADRGHAFQVKGV